MKSIEERAKEYVEPIYGVDSYSEGDEIYSAFCDGAESEHEELTKWNSPGELPDKGKWILMKVTGKDKSVFYIQAVCFTGSFYDFAKIKQELVGWRYIHE